LGWPRVGTNQGKGGEKGEEVSDLCASAKGRGVGLRCAREGRGGGGDAPAHRKRVIKGEKGKKEEGDSSAHEKDNLALRKKDLCHAWA